MNIVSIKQSGPPSKKGMFQLCIIDDRGNHYTRHCKPLGGQVYRGHWLNGSLDALETQSAILDEWLLQRGVKDRPNVYKSQGYGIYDLGAPSRYRESVKAEQTRAQRIISRQRTLLEEQQQAQAIAKAS